MDGFIVLNKEQDFTSHDCVAIVRGILGGEKVGHAGTLDPNATGVLPICVGRATKLIEYIDKAEKTYICTVKLGVSTDTQDIWGAVSESVSDFEFPGSDVISGVLDSFIGESMQLPPMYSAVRVSGRRLYSYARAGEEVEVRPRRISISSILLTGTDPENGTFSFKVTCSRGTYVRTICHDAGAKLGIPACLCGLCRTSSCGFFIDEAYTISDLRAMGKDGVSGIMLPADRGAAALPRLDLDSEKLYSMYCDGMTLKLASDGFEQDSPIAVYYNGCFLGVAKFAGRSLKPVKIIFGRG